MSGCVVHTERIHDAARHVRERKLAGGAGAGGAAIDEVTDAVVLAILQRHEHDLLAQVRILLAADPETEGCDDLTRIDEHHEQIRTAIVDLEQRASIGSYCSLQSLRSALRLLRARARDEEVARHARLHAGKLHADP